MPPSTINLPSIPVNLTVGFDQQSSASLAFFLFLALLMALMVYGFVFQR